MLFLSLRTLPRSLSRFHTFSTHLNSSHQNLLRILQSSIQDQCLPITQQSHAQIFLLGYDQDPFLATKLITGYSVCGNPSESRLVFNSIHHKNIFLWNSMISGYARNHIFREPFTLFNQMSCNGMPDGYTFATLAKICSDFEDIRTGKMIHCRIIRTGFESETVVANSIMAMYCNCRSLSDARTLFDEISHRSVASWNVLISEYASLDGFLSDGQIWKLIKQMQIEAMKPDAYTVASLLPLCANGTCGLAYGREIHCYIIKNGFGLGSDLHVNSCLIDMYSKSRNIVIARRVFDGMYNRNIVVWTAMIAGYVQNGDPEEALTLFRTMQVTHGIVPNEISLVSILPACSAIADLMEGKEIHGFAIRLELNNWTSVSNALIDMYSKCGSLRGARCVFDDDSFWKDPISWSSMIVAYGLHGRGMEAVLLFNELLRRGEKPDNIAFIGVLSACGRAGLVTEGFEIYNLLTVEFGIVPTMEICSCMVDMLGRAGQLDRALDFINLMPMKPGPSVWGALFSASMIHENLKMQDLAYGFLVQVEPENPANYVRISNTHASSGRWEVVAEVRLQMKERGLTKLPGCSWISVESKIHSFYAGDKSHPCSDLIYAILENLLLIMKGVDHSDFEIFDIDVYSWVCSS